MTLAEYSKKLSEFQDSYDKGTIEHDDCIDMLTVIEQVDSTVAGLPLTLITRCNKDTITDGVVANVLEAAKATLDYLTPKCVIEDNNAKLLLKFVQDVLRGEKVAIGDLVDYTSACNLAPCVLSGTVEDIVTGIVNEIHMKSVYSSDMKLVFMEVVK